MLQLQAVVDGIYTEQGHTAGSFTRLASDRLLVGGGADARSLQGAKGINNFVGCLRKVGCGKSYTYTDGFVLKPFFMHQLVYTEFNDVVLRIVFL